LRGGACTVEAWYEVGYFKLGGGIEDKQCDHNYPVETKCTKKQKRSSYAEFIRASDDFKRTIKKESKHILDQMTVLGDELKKMSEHLEHEKHDSKKE